MSYVAVTHQETSQCFHALYEGNATESDRGVYTEGVGCDQPDPWSQGLFALAASSTEVIW